MSNEIVEVGKIKDLYYVKDNEPGTVYKHTFKKQPRLFFNKKEHSFIFTGNYSKRSGIEDLDLSVKYNPCHKKIGKKNPAPLYGDYEAEEKDEPDTDFETILNDFIEHEKLDYITEQIDEGDEFSNSTCDICKSHLAGKRFNLVAHRNKPKNKIEAIDYNICQDCVDNLTSY